MASEYIVYGGLKLYSGVPHGDPSTGQIRFDWNSKYIAQTLSRPGYTSRAIFNGDFKCSNGVLTGNITSITSFTYYSEAGVVTETGSSWNIKPEYGSLDTGSGGLGSSKAIEETASSVNYLYRTKDSISLTSSSGPFANIAYYSSKESMKNLLNVSLFPDAWWSSPFLLPATGSASTNTGGTSTTAVLATTAAVDTLTGTAKKADTFDFSSSPNYNSSADRITNFSTKDKDKVQITSSVFGLSGKGTFKIAKNLKSFGKLSKTDTQFIYNKADGGLYFNQNGPEAGFGTGGIFAILEGNPSLVTKNVSVIA